MSAEKVMRFLKEMRAVKGARYGWHFVARGDTHLPFAEPMYTRGKHSAEYVKKHGVNCTGLGNQALGRMGLPLPEVRTNRWWTGGIPEWFDALDNLHKITARELERGFPVGTALISDYIDDNHQGHIVWVTTPMKNGKQMTIGSDDAEPGPGTPGVTEQRTAREAVRLFGLTHAGETPGVGVMGQGQAEAEDLADGARPDGEVSGTFSVVDLREAMPTLPLQKAKDYFPHLAAAMREAGITTRLRACHFLAQLGHESADLLYMQELGDRGYFMRYEGRRDLGNTQPGDGPRYHGRGPIQLTGRANYRSAGRDLGLDLERNPEKAADPDVAFRIAGWYWTTRNLNKFADLGDAGVDDVTRLINGGYNGLDDRRKRYFTCKRVLPESFSVGKGRGADEEGDGGEMAFQNVMLAHATYEDGVLAHEAAAVLLRHDIRCTVVDSSNMKAAIARCQDEPVGWGDFVVIGRAAEDMFPDNLKKHIGRPPEDSDYRDAAGEDLEETADKLARVLDGIASRKDVSGDLRGEFESSASLEDLSRLADKARKRRSEDELEDSAPDSDEEYEDGERSPRRRSEDRGERERGRRRVRASNGRKAKREELEEEPEVVAPDDLTDQDLEEIGKEALELFATIRKLTGQGRS